MALLYGAAEVATRARAGGSPSATSTTAGAAARRTGTSRFVREQARRLGLPFVSPARDARGRGAGAPPLAGGGSAARALRGAARDGRRGRRRIVSPTAHQKDDVARDRTCSRRSGAAASALWPGPRERRADGVVRPLLVGLARGDPARTSRTAASRFRRDASNGDLRLARNRVRRELAGLRSAFRSASRRSRRDRRPPRRARAPRARARRADPPRCDSRRTGGAVADAALSRRPARRELARLALDAARRRPSPARAGRR